MLTEFFQLPSDDVNGSNLMDMMHDESMLEQLAAAKSFPRKIITNLDMANLLKQVQSGAAQHQQKMSPSSSSVQSISPRSSSPNAIQSSTQHMLLTPVAPSTSSTIDPSK